MPSMRQMSCFIIASQKLHFRRLNTVESIKKNNAIGNDLRKRVNFLSMKGLNSGLWMKVFVILLLETSLILVQCNNNISTWAPAIFETRCLLWSKCLWKPLWFLSLNNSTGKCTGKIKAFMCSQKLWLISFEPKYLLCSSNLLPSKILWDSMLNVQGSHFLFSQ